MAYQNLTRFDGSMYGQPAYGGLEYDWEVPDNLIVGSPGGVSSQHHHYTKGFYGKGNSSSDIYGGQGERYISGEYGNLYEEGQSANQGMGYYGDAPDYPFYNKDLPVDTTSNKSTLADEDIEYVDDPKKKVKKLSKENYTPISSDGFSDTTPYYKKWLRNLCTFLWLVLLFICIAMWYNFFISSVMTVQDERKRSAIFLAVLAALTIAVVTAFNFSSN